MWKIGHKYCCPVWESSQNVYALYGKHGANIGRSIIILGNEKNGVNRLTSMWEATDVRKVIALCSWGCCQPQSPVQAMCNMVDSVQLGSGISSVCRTVYSAGLSKPLMGLLVVVFIWENDLLQTILL